MNELTPRRRRIAPPPQPLRIHRASLPDLVRNRLRTMIVRGVLSPGGNIGEVELAQSLGISRTPLREALKLLATEGLVELQSNRGAFVVPVRAEDVADIFDVAAALEQRGAELAALRGTEREFAELRRLQRQMEAEHKAERREPYFELNQTIHRRIVEIGRNATLQATHEALFARVQRIRFMALRSQARWDQSIAEHRDILAALEARNPALAGAALAQHVRHTGDHAAKLLETANLQPGQVNQ